MATSDAAKQDRLRQRKVAHVQRFKLERGCADCGYREHAVALDLDHRNPAEKHPGLKRTSTDHRPRCVWALNWEDLVAELLKCDVVCANCHRVRTHGKVA